jgi:hypothetical protein
MDPTTTFCPTLACPARGQRGQGNLGLPSGKDKRFICTECPKTCSATQGTAFSRLRTSAETGSLVLTRMAHGGPPPATVAAFGCDERTVAAWGTRAGGQGQAVQEPLGEPPRALGQGQADAIRVKQQGGIGWMARYEGLHPVVAGWGGQRAARHAVAPAAARAGACRRAPSSAVVVYGWRVLLHPSDARDLSRPAPARSPRASPSAPGAQRLHRPGRAALHPAARRRRRAPHRGGHARAR